MGLICPAVMVLAFANTGNCGSVTLSWDALNGADYYVVYWGKSAGGDDVKSENIGNETSYQIDNLEAEQDYFFSVRAFNNCGNSSSNQEWIPMKISEDVTPEGEDIADEVDAGGVEEEVVADEVDAGGVEEEVVVDEGDSGDAGDDDAGVVSDSDMSLTLPPGDASSDGFSPHPESVWVDKSDGNATIEVLDTNFEHLYWLKSGWSDYNELNGESRVTMGDIDGDGENELVIGYAAVSSDPMIPGGFFQVLDDDYSHLAWGRVEWDDYNTFNGETRPVCGDIDGDKVDEIIIGLGPNGKGYMEVFDFKDGTLSHQSWLHIQWPDYNEMIGEVRPVCGDVNGDGIDEIIAGLSSQSGTSDIPGGRFEVFGFNASAWEHMMWGTVNWPEYTDINGETWPEPGDIDGDGSLELVVGLGYGSDGQMAVFEFINGEAVLSEWAQIDWPEYNELTGETRPVCGDLDSDGKDDVIIGWNLPPEELDQTTYFKVLSYNSNTKALQSLKDSKSATVNIDGQPVKGVLTDKDNLIVGLARGMTETSASIPYSGTDASTPVVGADAGGAGCFVASVKE